MGVVTFVRLLDFVDEQLGSEDRRIPRPLGVFALALALAACTADDASRRTLETAGFSSVEIDGRAWLACGRGDLLATAFHAVSPGGEHVAGAVCCGVLTACTVRVQ